jgi:hypothetical protein
MTNNAIFFDYLESLIKEDKIHYAFIQIEGFLHQIEGTKGDVAELNPAKSHYTLLENRYTRWRGSLGRVDSRDSQTEINQIVAGILSGMDSLKILPDINYTAFQHIPEPVDSADEIAVLRPGRKFKWYWWVALALAAFSAAGVIYLLLHKDKEVPIPKAPTLPKKALTLILHELGDRTSRSIFNQGRLTISDVNNQRIGKDIGNDGVVRFDSLANWVFEAKPFVILDLQGLDERDYTYRLLDSLYAPFIVNDTVFVPYIKTELIKTPDTSPTPPTAVEQLHLYFFAEKNKVKKPFTFPKNSSVKQLKDFIINKFVDKDALRYGAETKLEVGVEHRELFKETQSLEEASIKKNDVLYLNIINTRAASYRTLPEPEQAKLTIKGQKFDKPVIKFNNDAVQSTKTKEGISISVPATLSNGKCTISIQDGDSFYTHEMDASTLKEMTLDINAMRKSAIKATMFERQKVEPLTPK